MAVGRQHTPVKHRLAVLATLTAAATAMVIPSSSTLASAAPGAHGSGETARSLRTSHRSAVIQEKVDAASAAYQEARQKVAGLSAQAARLTANAEAAEATASRLREQVADQQGGVLHALGDLVSPGESDVDKAADAAANAEDARRLSDMVQAALATSIDDAEKDRLAWEAAQRKQERVEATWTARQVVAAAIRRSQLPAAYAVTDPAQDRRNHRALRAWVRYLHQVGAAAVVPPPAKQLANPRHWTAPLEPVRVAGFRPVHGVAQSRLPDGRPVTVLPSETVRAVSEAFHRLGLTEVPGGVAASTYACGGLVANAWGSSMVTLPADAATQLTDLPAVPRAVMQVGDLVVLGNRRTGRGETGVYVGRQLAIVADASTGTAAVRALTPRGVLAVRRPTLPTDKPAKGADAVTAPTSGTCATLSDASTSAPSDGSGPFVLPMAAGSYTLSAGFGSAGDRWSSGAHTGQDFAAPIGTPVMSAGSGTVTIEHPSWAGNLVRIDHGGGVETLYAHLSRVDVADGQTVRPGEQVGAVGDLGNTTGPHLHFEVRLDGVPVDPTQVLDVPEAPRATYTNGEVPSNALCAATPDGVQQLRCDAAVAFRLMSASFEQDNGTSLCITDSYRSRAGQELVHVQKPNLTATPGTSVHGWGLAVDLCGGIESFDTPEHAWMMTQGPAFGWHHPSWAEAGGSRPEPWHFEYEG